jgi:hypothetical protein
MTWRAFTMTTTFAIMQSLRLDWARAALFTPEPA